MLSALTRIILLLFHKWEIEEIISDKNKNLDPIEILQFIESRCGILINTGLGRYSFLHKTFQEYFASLYIAKSSSSLPSNLKLERISDPFWREVFVLAFEQLSYKNKHNLIKSSIHEILNGINSLLNSSLYSNQNATSLDTFVEKVYNLVEKNFGNEEDGKLKAALRVFFFDPDYYLDSSRTLLVELDKKFGNILVASSFIIRLFLYEETEESDLDFLLAFKIAKNIAERDANLRNADNTDHVLEIVYNYVKNSSYILHIGNQQTLILRDNEIKNKLEDIYEKSELNSALKAEKCRHVCREQQKLKSLVELSEIKRSFNGEYTEVSDLDTCLKFYNANLLLVRCLNKIKFHFDNLGCQVENLVIIPSTKLSQVITNSIDNSKLSQYRFSGQLSNDYELWQAARSHIDNLLDRVKTTLIDHQKYNVNSEIYILEIGCGTGKLTQKIIENLSRTKLIALDK